MNRLLQCVWMIPAVTVLAGCGGISELGFGGPQVMPPEFHEKVGLYVHDKPERFFYPGSATLNVSDLMSFHLQQTLPFTAQAAFREIFKDVELSESGPKIQFKSGDLAGYFEIKISSARYDWPDPNATRFQAEVELSVFFRTIEEEIIWKGIFSGEGIGFTDTNIRLTKFGREAATALEEAFQNAVYEMQDAVAKSPTLREYLRLYQAHKVKPKQHSPLVLT